MRDKLITTVGLGVVVIVLVFLAVVISRQGGDDSSEPTPVSTVESTQTATSTPTRDPTLEPDPTATPVPTATAVYFSIPPAKNKLSGEAEEIRKTALSSPTFAPHPDQGAELASDESGFQITYVTPDDRFIIHIWDDENPIATTLKAEEYFLTEIAKTGNLRAVCELNIDVAVYAFGDVTRPSFCE